MPSYPTRTSKQIPTRIDISNLLPTRSTISSEDFFESNYNKLNSNEEVSNNYIDENAFFQHEPPRRTTKQNSHDVDSQEIYSNLLPRVIDTIIKDDSKLLKDKDLLSFNTWFYNDIDDSEENGKLNKDDNESDLIQDGFKDRNNTIDEEIIEAEENEIIDFLEINNITSRKTQSNVTNIFNATKEKFKGKLQPSCNLKKLRPLSFNSPRSLPEVNFNCLHIINILTIHVICIVQ